MKSLAYDCSRRRCSVGFVPKRRQTQTSMLLPLRDTLNARQLVLAFSAWRMQREYHGGT
jgi:hypothetical protein